MADYAKRRTQVAKLKHALEAVNELAASLPSRDDLARADASLAEVADFIRSVRNRLTHVPTADEVGSVLKAVDELQRLFERAEMSPTLSLALGIEAARPSPRRRAAPTLSSTISVDEVSSRFGDLTVDQLREKLSDERQLSIAEIRGIAKALGARAGSRVGRDALVANIVTKITNLRGYRALGPAPESQVGKKERT